jgi:poly-beta-1,6-N-acetyl-D-glucosamine biosynthesis protein PgaD
VSTEARDRRQVRAEMPIIDVARVPLSELRQYAPRRAVLLFVWLRVLRPALVAILWLLTVRYVWRQLFGEPDDLPLWQQAAIYGAAILLILLVMLVLVRLRRRQGEQESSSLFQTSTLAEMSSMVNVSTEELEQWQQAQRLVIHHDDDGMVERAEDTAKLLREADKAT